MATKAIGNTGSHETWQSGRMSESADGRTMRHVVTGPYSALEAEMPRSGKKWQGRTVVSATLEPLRGGMGRLEVTVRLRKRRGGSSSGGGDGDAGAASVVEIDMAQTEEDVRTLLAGHPDAARQLASWEESEPAEKAALRYLDAADGEYHDLDWPADTVAKLIIAGHESVLRFHPVVTRTTYLDEEPDDDVDGLGEVGGEPPGSPKGYEYLKTGDHRTEARDGSWTRTEQWTGARTWNGTLYKGGTGEPKDISLQEG